MKVSLQIIHIQTCAKGHLQVAVSCPLGSVLICPVKIREVVSGALIKGHAPVNKGHFWNSSWLTVVDRFDCSFI